ncbi:MAG: hypothetical protein JRJ11_02185 [Deltaproteobacteria bacterium]|nr:hypothetical protein [Deltaproteobacteria bacterium]MBW1908338.1 hypothetical protein [Deltaproteobacteria bacterium]MBW2034778.1 hypothetical protein [Deltaproteobacteria bacterium]MBW2167762.1 hypothetical protein [Deltaproteobacteria bacterium]MBW2358068.1 hypothetical protein [Deltaproteobacteria bacterium]
MESLLPGMRPFKKDIHPPFEDFSEEFAGFFIYLSLLCVDLGLNNSGTDSFAYLPINKGPSCQEKTPGWQGVGVNEDIQT